ncbi:MAG: hypothetical protein E7672_00340 [Ruminococcaceae bacterium]|nr:hypothetical protein [Oscillospiraceae bacterium]
MRDKHIFSKSYEDKKRAVLSALAREGAADKTEKRTSAYNRYIPLKIAAIAAALSVLSVGVYAAVQFVDFRIEQNGYDVLVHAGISEGKTDPDLTGSKPLRSWNAGEGEINVTLNIPSMPEDMVPDLTANGKWEGTDDSRSITFNGVDLRRGDLDHLIDGAVGTERIEAGKNSIYVIKKSEASYYDRVVYIVLEEDEFVVKAWVSYGITDDELVNIASEISVEETNDITLTIPILNELGDTTESGLPDVWTRDERHIHTSSLSQIGEAVTEERGEYTITVNRAEFFDDIKSLDPSAIIYKDFIDRFVDENGSFITYNRTPVIYNEENNTRYFGESETVKKRLCVVTLTVDNVTVDDEFLTACINGFNLRGYSVEGDEVKIQYADNCVVDRVPNKYAVTTSPVYREYLGDGQYRVGYLIDEDKCDTDLMIESYTGEIYIKIK